MSTEENREETIEEELDREDAEDFAEDQAMSFQERACKTGAIIGLKVGGLLSKLGRGAKKTIRGLGAGVRAMKKEFKGE